MIGVKGSAFQREQIEKQENRQLLEAIAGDVLGRKVRVKVQSVAEDPTTDPASASKVKQPVKKKPEEQDPLVQDALRIFGGEVVKQDRSEE